MNDLGSLKLTSRSRETLPSPQAPLAGTTGAETQEENEEWRCLTESDGVENPLCKKCRSLMCSSGLRQVTSAEGFTHTLVPPRVPKPWLVPWPSPTNTKCPLCKICFALFPPPGSEPVVWSLTIRQGLCSLVLESRPHPNMDRPASKTQAICVLAEQDMLLEAGIRSPIRDIGGDLALLVIKDQLGKCIDHHQNCYAGAEQMPLLPKRVLDVSPLAPNNQPNMCRLHESKGERGSYITLSYCWGTRPQALALSEDNLSQLKREILRNTLGRCIQDAIKVTRSLGIRYLWVDALCILQDNEKDKAAEIAKMGEIYRNATLVLAAASSPGSDESFLYPREIFQNEGLFRFPTIVRGKPVSMLVSKLSILDEGGGGGLQTVDTRDHLNKRAWTLQECSLARRLLLYSGNEVFWHCRQTSSISSHPSYIGRWDALAPISMNVTFQSLSEIQLSPDWLRGWFKVVEDYTRRQMSDPADSLNALAGITRELGIMTGQRYIHGLWDIFLPECLLWRTFATRLPSRWSQYSGVVDMKQLLRIPSWSWAGNHLPVRMDLGEQFVRHATILTVQEEEESVVSALQLRGVKCTYEDLVERGWGTFYPDTERDGWERMPKVGFYMGYFESRGRYPGNLSNSKAEIFLVLNGIGEDRYRRIGIFHCISRNGNPFSHGRAEETIWIE